jgi:hypothetical protein
MRQAMELSELDGDLGGSVQAAGVQIHERGKSGYVVEDRGDHDSGGGAEPGIVEDGLRHAKLLVALGHKPTLRWKLISEGHIEKGPGSMMRVPA